MTLILSYQHDTIRDGKSNISSDHISSEEKEAVDHHSNVGADSPVQPDTKPSGGRQEGEPSGGVDILLIIKLTPQ